jgi:D-alanyl-D-alanine carboxypeptidase/D-alanyl-D-alanine-endopeptidase (penicillin-binding protein 4)
MRRSAATPFAAGLATLGRLAWLALCTAWLATAGAADALPPTVRLALEHARIPAEAVSVWVQPVDAAAPSLAVNAGQPMNPASVMKLVTTFAALETLGPAHRWTTRLVHDGAIRGGTLDGTLYLVGGADPVLGYERLWKMLRRLRALGIERVAGDIVLDGSVLRLPPHDPAAFDGKGLRPYNSGPHGLLLHFNTLQLALFPAVRAGEPVTVAAEPPLAGVDIDNRIQTADGPCEIWYRDLEASLEPGRRLVLRGSLPASCGARNWSAAPLPPEAFGSALVAGLWAEIGGRLQGQVRPGVAPPGAAALFEDESAPLAEVLREMNKWSSNVIARQLLAALGASAAAAGAEAEADMVRGGARLAAERLAAAGIDTRGLVIENGAGLSRLERIRADSLGQLLAAAWRRPWMPEFIAALPIAGQDGTARKRLAGSPANGRAHIKTGTLDGVRAFAGYVLDHDGRRHAVVMMVNHPEAAASQAAQDALIEWVWAGALG